MDTDIDGLPARLRNLEETAFCEFSTAFGSRLRRYFLSLGACPADAESLTVSVLTDSALKVDRFEDRGPGSFAAWVLRLARNSWVDDRRRTLPPLTHEVADWVPLAANPALARDIAAALDGLSETDRVILTARYFEGEASFAEIGRKVDMTASAVRVRHHRLIRRLSDKLAAYAPGASTAAVPFSEEDPEDGCRSEQE